MDKLEQYHILDRQVKLISERLTKLNKEIKQDVIRRGTEKEGLYILEAGSGYKAVVTRRRSKSRPDEGALSALLDFKGLDWCFKKVPDESLVEQAYIEGHITDDDLRSIGAEPKFTLALSVERVEEDVDVQGNNESMGGESRD